MLRVVTGLPGAGKTLYTLSVLLKQYRGRKIYTYGIPGIDHEYYGSADLEDPESWYDLDDGSVVVIDEAQKVFPVRPNGSPVPKKCSEFETHRHRGFDVVLLTQDGTTLDVHIRKLAGNHVHVSRMFNGHTAMIYEYAKFQPKPTDKNTQKLSLSVKPWKYDKSTFEHYKSADLHTVKRKIPFKILMVPVVVLAAIAAIVGAIWGVSNLFEERKADISTVGPSSTSAGSVQSGDVRLGYAEQFVPEVPGIPWSAPAYQEVAKVRTFPKPYCVIIHEHVSDITSVSSCRCYSQQATLIKGVPLEVCGDIAVNGWFDFTKDEERRAENRPEDGSARRSDQRVNAVFR